MHGVPISKVKIHPEYSIDIVTDELTMGVLVSKYEENAVRSELGYTFKEWRELTPEERAEEIATKRINQKIEYVKYLKSINKI